MARTELLRSGVTRGSRFLARSLLQSQRTVITESIVELSPTNPHIGTVRALSFFSSRAFSTSPAEEDVVKAAFIRQQTAFRSYLEGVKKVSIPLNANDDKAVHAYEDAIKAIRQSVGIPSFTEKLANLLESAEEDSQGVRSFLEESRSIRRQLGLEDTLGFEALIFKALDSVEKKLGKPLTSADAKGMQDLQDEVSAINKKLGLDDAQLEQLEDELEHQLAKNEIAAFAKEASESIDTYKKRDGLEDLDVDLKSLNPKPYL